MNDPQTNTDDHTPLYIEFMIETGRVKFGDRRPSLEFSKQVENASVHFEDIDLQEGRVEAEFYGPIELKVSTDEHADSDVFDFSVSSKLTGHLREAAFTFSAEDLGKFISDLNHLRDALAIRKEEQRLNGIEEQRDFELWKLARTKSS